SRSRRHGVRADGRAAARELAVIQVVVGDAAAGGQAAPVDAVGILCARPVYGVAGDLHARGVRGPYAGTGVRASGAGGHRDRIPRHGGAGQVIQIDRSRLVRADLVDTVRRVALE